MLRYKANQGAYLAKGWEPYLNGGYNTERDAKISPPINGWKPGKEPK